MKNDRYILAFAVASLVSLPLRAQNPDTVCATPACKAVQVARDWTKAWNEKDINYMLAVHHPDVIYVWRGRPLSYRFFREILPTVFKEEDYDLVVDPSPTVISFGDDHQWLYFRMAKRHESGELEPQLAVTMLLARVGPGWKIRTIHESKVLPFP